MSISRNQVQRLHQKVIELGIKQSEIAREASVERQTVYRTLIKGRTNLDVIAAASKLVEQYKTRDVVTESKAVVLLEKALA